MTKTINFLIRGGLGNQLFQYAAGLYAEQHWGLPVQFDVLAPCGDNASPPRPFMLDQFMITRPICRLSTIKWRWLYGTNMMSLRKMGHRIWGIHVLDEAVLHSKDSLIQAVPPGRRVFLRGYWQSKEYIESIAGRLRDEFRFRYQPEGRNAATLIQIKNEPCPVSLHIRRGDYRHISRGSILLPLDYYRAAIKQIHLHCSNARFFVFSDDLNWAREHLPREVPCVFVEGNSERQAQEDLRLMASCDHHIIANSSFSWWGAWLNSNPAKTVIMPKFWMGAMPTPNGLIPDGWQRCA